MNLSEHADVLAEWTRRHRVWLVRAAAVAGGVVVGGTVLFSSGVHDLWNSPQKPKPPHAVPLSPVVPAPLSVKNLQGDTTQGRLGTDSSVSKVPLRLHLIRTLPGRNVHSGQALLGVDRDHPQTYMAGAILENGARLEEVHMDHVVLVRGFSRTRLDVERPGTEVTAQPDALAMVGGPPSSTQTLRPSSEPVTDYLRPVPVYRDDVVVGFQVYPGRQSAIFSRWGLQSGDVLTDLDGQPASDPDQLMQMLHGLIDGEAIRATVLRNGATVSVRLDGTAIQQLTASTPTSGPD
jgi:type II secretion system protein C